MTVASRLILALSASTLIAGCAAGGGQAPPFVDVVTTPTPAPGGGACPQYLPTPPQLLYPMSGATVPGFNLTLVLAALSPAQASFFQPPLLVTGSFQKYADPLGPPPNPLPTPEATPAPGFTSTYGSLAGNLVPHSPYRVYAVSGFPGCFFYQQIGVFNTQ
jgi:hypothetical protein